MLKKSKESHFIKSPYKVVTEYENQFIKSFNNNIAAAVADVLKYIARATAAEIKNAKENEKID